MLPRRCQEIEATRRRWTCERRLLVPRCEMGDDMRILIVDDEPTVAIFLQEVLEDAGYTVTVAANGRDAFEVLETTQPDLVLCDRMMPLMDGVEFCRIFRANPAYRDIPIILMSADAVDERLCQPTAFIIKPFMIDDLLATVANCLVV